jgi:GNAT superfamily N-acetyltransferase
MTEKKTDFLKDIVRDFSYVPFSGSPFYAQDKTEAYLLKSVADAISEKKADVITDRGKDVALVMHPMPWDSRHFGMKIGRISHILYRDAVKKDKANFRKIIGKAKEKALSDGLKSLICFLDPRELNLSEALEDEGFYLKGMLVDYYLSLDKYSAPGFSSGTEIRLAQKKDEEKIAKISFDAFSKEKDWFDHFHADPFYPREKSDSLYSEWIHNSFSGDQADAVLAAYDRDEPVGFITLKKERDKSGFFKVDYAAVPLNAVDSGYRKKGVYRDLVAAGLDWFRKEGVDVAYVRTQASTIAVQKTWQGLGAKVEMFQLVFHGNL